MKFVLNINDLRALKAELFCFAILAVESLPTIGISLVAVFFLLKLKIEKYVYRFQNFLSNKYNFV